MRRNKGLRIRIGVPPDAFTAMRAIFPAMSTLAEIGAAIPQFTASELAELEQFVRRTKREKAMEPRSRRAVGATLCPPLSVGGYG